MRREEEDVTSPGKFIDPGVLHRRSEKAPVQQDYRKKPGTFTRRPRPDSKLQIAKKKLLPQGSKTNKQTKQIWVQVPVQVVGEGDSESAGKHQKTTSVFDRLEDPSADPARQGRREQ
jgi:hypothetical protein